MTRERFDALVGELEAKAEVDFSAYKLRLLGLALLGYVYIFFILALIFALILTLIVLAFFGKAGVVGVALKFSLPLLLLAGVVVRALWVRVAPPDAFLEMPNALKTRLAPDIAERWLRQSLSARTGAADTHPALADRLRAIGAKPQIPEPAGVTAAEEFFGEALPRLIEALNEEWKHHVAEGWRERHKAMREKGGRLDALDAQAERAQLNFSDRYGHHQASPEAIEKITAKLAEYDEVAAAYLIRKEVKIFPDFPLYVCGIDPKPQKGGRSEEANQALGDILARNLEFPGETFVVILGSGNQKMGRIMQEIDGSRIYP